MYKFILITLFLFTNLTNSVAQNLKSFDYSKADSLALELNQEILDIKKLAMELTQNLETEQEKFRSIFRWVTNNISYNINQKSSNSSEVIDKRSAVCSGYSNLLQALCQQSRIECVVINGFSKVQETKDIGKLKKANHAWNAVKLNNTWYLIDATWAAGHVKRRKFTKDFDEFYFLTDPDKFIYRHYPSDEKWKLSSSKLSFKEFGKMPIYKDEFFEKGLKMITFPNGEIKNNLQFEFISETPIRKISYHFANQKKFVPVEFLENENIYSVSIDFNKYQSGELLIYVNNKAVIGFVKK